MQEPVAARMPDFTAAPLPLLYGCRTTRAPAHDASVAVASPDPSSTTRISRHGAAALSARTTEPIDAASLKAGITMDVSDGSAISQQGSASAPSHEAIDDVIPRDVANALEAAAPRRAGPPPIGGEPRDCRSEGFGLRFRDDPADAVFDELEGAAGIRRRHDRLAREKRFQGHVPVILVERRKDNRERA